MIIVYLGVIFIFWHGTVVNSTEVSKCFGADIGFTCGNGTRIAISWLRYGTSANDNCTIDDVKCNQTITDFSEKYPYYYKNSGFETASDSTIIQWDNSECPKNNIKISTNIMMGSYECIQESKIVDICSSRKVSLQMEAYMLYPIPKTPRANTTYCHCRIESDEGIDIKAVDVRLHHSNGTCGSLDTHLDIRDSTYNTSLTCEAQTMWDEYQLLFQSNEKAVNMSLHQGVSEDDKPQMVFLQIRGRRNSMVNVICNEEGLTTPSITTEVTTTNRQGVKSSTSSGSGKLPTKQKNSKLTTKHATSHKTFKVKNHGRKATTMSPKAVKSKKRSEVNLAMYIVIGLAGVFSLLVIGIGVLKWRSQPREEMKTNGNTNKGFNDVISNRDLLMQDRINRFLVNDKTDSKPS